jgi:hypothetical protein
MTIRDLLTSNPELSNAEIAARLGVGIAAVCNKRSLMRQLERMEAEQPGIVASAQGMGIDPLTVTHGWGKDGNFSLFFKDGSSQPATYESLTDLLVERMQAHSPVYERPVFKKPIDGHLFVYDPADIHLNKLALAYETGKDYNSQIAVHRCREGMAGLLNKAMGFNIDEILFILGNDAINADGPSNATTKGTRQDTHTLWTEAFLMAFDIFIEQIETAASIAPVFVKFNPSNHDVMAGWYLAQAIRIHFRLDSRVTFDCSTAHRKYHKYGKNLIGTTHGDGAKPEKLPSLMAYDAKEFWSNCKHYYFYTHHIHHKYSKDFGEVCVESLRSPSEADGWHDRNGFVGAPKAIEAFLHHPEHGQIARFTHIF